MPRPRDRTNVYILLIAVLVAAIAGYYLPTKRPETGASMTPKEYIELVEKKKAQRLKYTAEENASETTDQPTSDHSIDQGATGADTPAR
jgi:hypothetical protein